MAMDEDTMAGCTVLALLLVGAAFMGMVIYFLYQAALWLGRH